MQKNNTAGFVYNFAVCGNNLPPGDGDEVTIYSPPRQ